MFAKKIHNYYTRQYVFHNHVRDVARISSDPARYFQRKRLARDLPLPTVQIPEESGYVVLQADQIPGLSELQQPLRKLADGKLAALDMDAIEAGSKDGTVKPFYFNLIDRNDVIKTPELLSFALSPQMLAILTPYYGMIPEISHIAIFFSGLKLGSEMHEKAAQSMRGTQRLHWDNHDLRHIKFFNYLDAVGEDDGPLTVLPADKSWWLRKKTGRYFGTPPMKDDREFLRYFSKKDLVSITGPAGTAAFVDTTNCLHFGSRTVGTGQRKTFVIHYTKFADYGVVRTRPYQDLNVATSPECRAGLKLDRFGELAYRLVEPIG